MGDTTAISWTDATFNTHWGCLKVSPGCDNCYAEAFAKRTGHDVWEGRGRRFFSDKHWAQPLKWSPRRIFCASMGDIFENARDLDGVRHRLWDLIEATPQHTWQLLTKRPEQVVRLMPGSWLVHWPEHVWLGTTVEDQIRADLRIPRLERVPGHPLLFLSVEPLLGPVDLRPYLPTVDWVICGGESGPRRRPMDLDWAREIHWECVDNGVPFFFKQSSALRPGQPGPADLHVKELPVPRQPPASAVSLPASPVTTASDGLIPVPAGTAAPGTSERPGR